MPAGHQEPVARFAGRVWPREWICCSAPEDEVLAAAERTTFTYRVDLMNVRAQLTDGCARSAWPPTP